MGARSGARPWVGMALVLLLLVPAPRASVAGEQAMTPIEARVGTGWGARVACIGCVAAWVYVGTANPGLMLYHAVRTPALVDACAILCLQALE